MPLEYSCQWHMTKNQKNYDSDICSVYVRQVSNLGAKLLNNPPLKWPNQNVSLITFVSMMNLRN